MMETIAESMRCINEHNITFKIDRPYNGENLTYKTYTKCVIIERHNAFYCCTFQRKRFTCKISKFPKSYLTGSYEV